MHGKTTFANPESGFDLWKQWNILKHQPPYPPGETVVGFCARTRSFSDRIHKTPVNGFFFLFLFCSCGFYRRKAIRLSPPRAQHETAKILVSFSYTQRRRCRRRIIVFNIISIPPTPHVSVHPPSSWSPRGRLFFFFFFTAFVLRIP